MDVRHRCPVQGGRVHQRLDPQSTPGQRLLLSVALKCPLHSDEPVDMERSRSCPGRHQRCIAPVERFPDLPGFGHTEVRTGSSSRVNGNVY